MSRAEVRPISRPDVNWISASRGILTTRRMKKPTFQCRSFAEDGCRDVVLSISVLVLLTYEELDATGWLHKTYSDTHLCPIQVKVSTDNYHDGPRPRSHVWRCFQAADQPADERVARSWCHSSSRARWLCAHHPHVRRARSRYSGNSQGMSSTLITF